MIYFTSDTHFGEPRVLNIDRRPFSSLAEHDTALVANWNDTVSPEDEIWHLGDFASKKKGFAEDLLTRLNGRKHLIVGNNDSPGTVEASGWHTTLCGTDRRRPASHSLPLSVSDLEPDGKALDQPARPFPWPLETAAAAVRRRRRCQRPAAGQPARSSPALAREGIASP